MTASSTTSSSGRDKRFADQVERDAGALGDHHLTRRDTQALADLGARRSARPFGVEIDFRGCLLHGGDCLRGDAEGVFVGIELINLVQVVFLFDLIQRCSHAVYRFFQ